MRIVLDTNVLIAAFIARGVCHQLLEHCISHHDLVISEFILDEVREKLIVKFKYTLEVADETLNLWSCLKSDAAMKNGLGQANLRVDVLRRSRLSEMFIAEREKEWHKCATETTLSVQRL